MKIPSKVKIGGFDLTVKIDKDVALEGQIFGSTHCQTQTIFLDPTTTQQKREQTFLHEILHAISWQAGLDKQLADNKLEEKIISSLSFGLHQVLKDNGLSFK